MLLFLYLVVRLTPKKSYVHAFALINLKPFFFKVYPLLNKIAHEPCLIILKLTSKVDIIDWIQYETYYHERLLEEIRINTYQCFGSVGNKELQ